MERYNSYCGCIVKKKDLNIKKGIEKIKSSSDRFLKIG